MTIALTSTAPERSVRDLEDERISALIARLDELVASLRALGVPALARGCQHCDEAVTGRSAPYALSGRERDVLALMAAGHSNPAIAMRLRLAPKTVRNHVSVIFRKLGVASRVEAAVKAREAGLVPKLALLCTL